MNKIYLTIIFFLFFIICKSQSLQAIGFLRIGLNESILIDSLRNAGFAYKEVTDSRMPSKQQIVKYTEDPFGVLQISLYAPKIKGYSVYKITNVIVSNISLNLLTLEFYDGSLFSFRIDEPAFDFYQTLSSKYKSIKTVSFTKPVTCENGFGAVYHHEEKSIFQYYRNDKVSAIWINSIHYSDKCEELHTDAFEMYDNSKKKMVENLTAAEEKKREKQDENETKNLHKDF